MGASPPGPGKISSSFSRVSESSSMAAARTALSSWSMVRGPMIGAVTMGLCSSQAMATSPGGWPIVLQRASYFSNWSRFSLTRFSKLSSFATSGIVFLQSAAQDPATQRAPRDQAQSIMAASRDDFQLHHAVIQVVNTLLTHQAQQAAF